LLLHSWADLKLLFQEQNQSVFLILNTEEIGAWAGLRGTGIISSWMVQGGFKPNFSFHSFGILRHTSRDKESGDSQNMLISGSAFRSSGRS
jgi:hypothetical protein